MQGIQSYLTEIESNVAHDGPKVEFEFQQLGIEMEKHFGKRFKGSIWGNFHKAEYNISVIRESWFTYQKQSIKSFPYFMGILNKKAGIKKLIKTNV